MKIKMAFQPEKGDSGLVLVDMDPSTANKKGDNNVVSNFGEYYTQQEGLLVEPVLLMDPNEEQGGGVGGQAFAVPFSLEENGGDNWIVAEEDEVEDGRGRKRKKSTIDANLTMESEVVHEMEEEEEEGWGAFDPDADDREEEEDMHVFQPEEEKEKGEGGSVASRVELVRGAEDSIASDRQLQVSCTIFMF